VRVRAHVIFIQAKVEHEDQKVDACTHLQTHTHAHTDVHAHDTYAHDTYAHDTYAHTDVHAHTRTHMTRYKQCLQYADWVAERHREHLSNVSSGVAVFEASAH
jgi:hypothetical protein